MATRRSTEERIEATKKLIENHEKHLQSLIKQQNAKDRKARTHRLCERGGSVESLLPALIKLTPEQFDIFVQKVLLTPYTKRILDELAPPPEKPADKETAKEDATTADSEESVQTPQVAQKATETSQGAATTTTQTVGNDAGKTG